MKTFLNVTLLLIFGGALLLTWPGAAAADQGQKLFNEKCASCHGEKGDGKGPMASTFDPKPGNFTDAKFWQGNVNSKITDAVTKGKNQMVPVNLKPDEMKAIIEYMTKTFKK